MIACFACGLMGKSPCFVRAFVARTPCVEEQRKIRSVHRAVVVHIGVSVCGALRGLRATSARNLPRDLAGGRIRVENAGRT